MYYSMTGVEPSDPMDDAGTWSVNIGSKVHEDWQQALSEKLEGVAEVTHEEHVHIPEANSSGHIDTVVRHLSEEGLHEVVNTTAIEVKTINGTGYQYSIGAARGPAKGPRWSAFLQGAVNAHGIRADIMKVVYLPLESISKTKARKENVPDALRTGAEWTYTRDQFEGPALEEIERWMWLIDCHEKQFKPPRWIPDPDLPPRSVVTNPTNGSTMNPEGQGGRTWMCEYCDFYSYCVTDE